MNEDYRKKQAAEVEKALQAQTAGKEEEGDLSPDHAVMRTASLEMSTYQFSQICCSAFLWML
jgi:hypothetical protein